MLSFSASIFGASLLHVVLLFIWKANHSLLSRPRGRLTHNREPYQKIYELMNALRPIHPKLWQQFLDFKK